jgi:hypothetical protein
MNIINSNPQNGYRLELQFDNGESGIVELSSLVGRGVFEAWNESGVFEQVTVTSAGAVEWPSEIDMCPDALYLQMMGHTVDALIDR